MIIEPFFDLLLQTHTQINIQKGIIHLIITR